MSKFRLGMSPFRLLLLSILAPVLVVVAAEPIARAVFSEQQWQERGDAPLVFVLWSSLGVGFLLSTSAIILAVAQRRGTSPRRYGRWMSGLTVAWPIAIVVLFIVGFRKDLQIADAPEEASKEQRDLRPAWVIQRWWGLPYAESVGFVGPDETFVIEPRFSYVYPFCEGRAVVTEKETGLQGVIDTNGEWVTKPKYVETGWQYSGGLLGVKTTEGTCGYIDGQGLFVIDPRFETVRSFSEGVAAARLDGRWGYIDARGKTAIDFRFDMAESFSEGRALVNVGGVEAADADDDEPPDSPGCRFFGSPKVRVGDLTVPATARRARSTAAEAAHPCPF